ncbi:hypothetical protein [Leifsonia xyli]|nr:hypothetical protein [Leifsonia xyli]
MAPFPGAIGWGTEQQATAPEVQELEVQELEGPQSVLAWAQAE